MPNYGKVKFGTLKWGAPFWYGDQILYIKIDNTLALNKTTDQKIGFLPRYDVIPADSSDFDNDQNDEDNLPF